MTVQELIEKLQNFPPDFPVVCNANMNEMANGQDIRAIEVIDQSRWICDEWHTDYFPDIPEEDEEKRRAVNITA